jgi:vacuolar-type H+-ATPase subunit I/STV1
MPALPDGSLFWGLTWANIIAFIGIVGNFIFTSYKDRKARKKATNLDTFNHLIRTPIETLIQELIGLMDEADDIVRSKKGWQHQIEATKELKPKFHSVRRKLARLLTDCDKSSLVAGKTWSALEQFDMDKASEALESASNRETIGSLRDDLSVFAVAITAVTDRLKIAVERYALSCI